MTTRTSAAVALIHDFRTSLPQATLSAVVGWILGLRATPALRIAAALSFAVLAATQLGCDRTQDADLLLPKVVASRDDLGSSRSDIGFAGCARARHPNIALITGEMRTTDGEIAESNLDALIAARARDLSRRPDDGAAAAALIEGWLERARFLDRLAGYASADELADCLVAQSPTAANLRVRARVRARLHRFDAALDDLTRAELLDGIGDQSGASAITASILEARGDFESAARIYQALATVQPSLVSLGSLAQLESRRGHLDLANQLFASAVRSHRDVSPFGVAWLEVELARHWHRAGRVDLARAYFASAESRLPHYVRAFVLHAELEAEQGQQATAIRLLTPLLDYAEDPEVAGHLGQLLAATGEVHRSAELSGRALQHMARLVERHPEAFADHAAELILQTGTDVGRAVQLAQINFAVRPTIEATRLLSTATSAFAERAERDALLTARR